MSLVHADRIENTSTATDGPFERRPNSLAEHTPLPAPKGLGMSAIGPQRTSLVALHMSGAVGHIHLPVAVAVQRNRLGALAARQAMPASYTL